MDARCHPTPSSVGDAPLRVLVVEDDRTIAEPLTEGLEHEGFAVHWVSSGAEALAADAGDIVLLDLGLPDLDGREVCRRLRERSHVPIIVVTARDDEVDRVLLLEMAADDYVVKPFGFRELVARIRAGASATASADAAGPPNRTTVRCVSIGGPSSMARRRGDQPDAQGVRPARTAHRGTRRARTREEIMPACGTRTGGARPRPSTSTSHRCDASSATPRRS